MVRTTLRIQGNLKKLAEKRAFEKEMPKKARKIIFKTHNLGKPLDNLKRADLYSEPK